MSTSPGVAGREGRGTGRQVLRIECPRHQGAEVAQEQGEERAIYHPFQLGPVS